MMSLTFGLFTQVSGSGPLGPLVEIIVTFKLISKLKLALFVIVQLLPLNTL